MTLIIPKLWGQERVLHNDSEYCMKELTLNQGYQSSLHMHKLKHETFLITAGEVQMEVGVNTFVLVRGEHVSIPPTTYHRFRSLTPHAAMVEASTTHSDFDVYRKEDSCSCRRSI